MSGLIKKGEGVTYLNIKEGKLVTKKNGVTETFDGVKGTITKVEFVKDEYEGRQYEKAAIHLNHDGQNYILQMHVDSGYFRNFCNALKSGKPKEEVYIQPSYKKDEKGKTSAGCFISQNGKFLKHAYTKDNMGELPPLETVILKGEKRYDNTKQIAFWKNWLSSTFTQDEEATQTQEDDDSGLPF
jgi:hypothetical protein